ncbi:MAG TPA: hypothetical protein VFN97_18515 [Actinospica sp.]|nr:hypothetical protein [Actinospica sp.]
MRVLMTVEMDTEKTNHTITDGTIEKVMKESFDDIRPEAAYFATHDGRRTGYIVFDLAEPNDMPRVAEPFFQAFDARVEFSPAMDFADVRSGMAKYANH